MSLALSWSGECAHIGTPARGRSPGAGGGRARHLQHLGGAEVRRPATFWDWTVIAYVTVGVVLGALLVNLSW